MITLRDETPDDYEHVRTVTIDAFARSERGHNDEAELVDSLRLNSGKYLSLVALSGHEIVGHILFTPVVIRTAQMESHGMGLGPLSVTPTLQRTGIGSSLVTTGCARLFAKACPFVVVLGRPEFYSRCEFRLASLHRIRHGFAGVPQHVFSLRMGPGETPERLRDGLAYYGRGFGAQHTETDHQPACDRGNRDV